MPHQGIRTSIKLTEFIIDLVYIVAGDRKWAPEIVPDEYFLFYCNISSDVIAIFLK